jgi:hypothetical protein
MDVHAFIKALYSETTQEEPKVPEVSFPPGVYLRIADQNTVSRRSHLNCGVQRGYDQRRLSNIPFQTTRLFDMNCDRQHQMIISGIPNYSRSFISF